MHKKIHYIISGLIFFSFLFLFLASFSDNVLSQTSDEDKYLCQKCNSSGKCTEYWDTKPCSMSCSGCKSYTCDACSSGTCKSKTYSNPCSDTCATNSDCSGNSCNKCKDDQCRIDQVATGTCNDQCSSNAQCVDADDDDEEEKGWRCRMDWGGICEEYEAKNPKYGSLAACEAKCPYGTYKHCGTAGCETGDCIKSFWYNVDPGDECEVDADCGNGGTPPPPDDTPEPTKYRCLDNKTCKSDPSGAYSSLSACEDYCKSSPSYRQCNVCQSTSRCGPQWFKTPACATAVALGYVLCTTSADCQTAPPPPPPPPSSETQPCMINYFELPERAWVDYPITGRWSAGAWCDDCDVDCTPYPECVWKQDSIGTGFDEYKFTLEQPGTYNYILTCYGEGGIDERTETATVEALNLPWWREIIPVLQGFLRGVWG